MCRPELLAITSTGITFIEEIIHKTLGANSSGCRLWAVELRQTVFSDRRLDKSIVYLNVYIVQKGPRGPVKASSGTLNLHPCLAVVLTIFLTGYFHYLPGVDPINKMLPLPAAVSTFTFSFNMLYRQITQAEAEHQPTFAPPLSYELEPMIYTISSTTGQTPQFIVA